jgi:hypothetical protein
MRRAGQRSIVFALALLAAPAAARAFHAGNQFDKPAGAGGGGGVFYTGAPRERGWDCTACHIDPPHTIQLDIGSMPASLLTTGQYAPNQSYAITAKLVGEHAGLKSPESNYNSFTVAVLDSKGALAGKFSGYAAEDLYDGGFVLISAGKKVGVTSWSFTWTAPAALSGAVTFYVSLVDGNGADSKPGVTLTDPWGDDVLAGSISIREAAVSSNEPFSRRAYTYRMGSHGHALDATDFALCRLLGNQRRRAGRRRRGTRRPGLERSGDARSVRRHAARRGHLSPGQQ